MEGSARAAKQCAAPPRLTGGLRVFVFFTIFLEAMGGGLVGPVLPSLMAKFAPGGLSEISVLIGWCAMIFSVALFAFAPLMGHLADRFGRRPIAMLSLAGSVLDYAVSATTQSLAVFMATRAIAGICAAGGVAVQATIADVTPPEKRARNFAMLGAGFGIGMVLGPPIGGLLGRTAPEAPFWMAAGLFALDFALGLFVLKETASARSRGPIAFRNLDPVRALLRIGRFRLGAILVVFVAVQLASNIENSVMVLYTQWKFGWSVAEVGFFYSMVGVALFVSKLALTPAILSAVGERRTILAGVFLHASCSLVYACAAQGWQMYIGLSLWLVAGMTLPTLMGVMSGRIASQQQGEYLGSLMSLQVALAGAGALTGTTIFSAVTGPQSSIVMPGMPFLLSSVLYAAALLTALLSGSGIVATRVAVDSPASTR